VESARRYIPITTLADAQQTPQLQDMKSGEGREGGAAHAGERGKAGDPKEPARRSRGGVKGPPDTEQVVLAREQILSQLDRVSILGTIKAASQQYEGLTSIFGAEQAMGRDLEDALAMYTGEALASTRGVFGGLGPRGTGHGGGGRAEGSIGVGEFGTRSGLGRDRYGDGVPLGGPDHKARVPRLRPGKIQAAGGLKKSVIRRIIRRQLPAIRHCYEQSLNTRPDLAGRVAVRFLIGATGVVRAAAVSSSTLGHPATERCVASVVQRLSFPAPAGGSMVKVTYPFTFTRAGR
jgi:TonB family protein